MSEVRHVGGDCSELAASHIGASFDSFRMGSLESARRTVSPNASEGTSAPNLLPSAATSSIMTEPRFAAIFDRAWSTTWEEFLGPPCGGVMPASSSAPCPDSACFTVSDGFFEMMSSTTFLNLAAPFSREARSIDPRVPIIKLGNRSGSGSGMPSEPLRLLLLLLLLRLPSLSLSTNLRSPARSPPPALPPAPPRRPWGCCPLLLFLCFSLLFFLCLPPSASSSADVSFSLLRSSSSKDERLRLITVLVVREACRSKARCCRTWNFTSTGSAAAPSGAQTVGIHTSEPRFKSLGLGGCGATAASHKRRTASASSTSS
mmetsp:Transcript_104815/g.266183  ORF Transcript_104815/g.266183 Transcript_104815/m.266183 type:complete len:317 (+) Transcript_104815:95-1045(+)